MVKLSFIVLKPFYVIYTFNEHPNFLDPPYLKKIIGVKDGNKL